MVLTIELENNRWVYAPGDTINGKVVIDKNIWNKVEGQFISILLFKGIDFELIKTFYLTNSGLTIRFCGRIEVGAKNDPFGLTPDRSSGLGQQSSRSGCVAGVRRIANRVHPLEDILLDHTINLIHNCNNLILIEFQRASFH